MSTARFSIKVVTDSAPPVVTVTGELDITNAADFVESTRSVPGPRPLVLDLSDLVYLDSAGLAMLDRLTGTNSAVVVIPPTSPMYRAATLMDLPRHDTVEDAITTASGSRPSR